jgi:hypothetical protein
MSEQLCFNSFCCFWGNPFIYTLHNRFSYSSECMHKSSKDEDGPGKSCPINNCKGTHHIEYYGNFLVWLSQVPWTKLKFMDEVTNLSTRVIMIEIRYKLKASNWTCWTSHHHIRHLILGNLHNIMFSIFRSTPNIHWCTHKHKWSSVLPSVQCSLIGEWESPEKRFLFLTFQESI